jgi:hypothetical protein
VCVGSALEDDYIFSGPISNASVKFEVRRDDTVTLELYQVIGEGRLAVSH